jgi:hypothetical protein
MTKIDLAEIRKIPFIDHANLFGRVINALWFFEDNEWHLWVCTTEGLKKISGFPTEGFYFAKAPERESDINLTFLEFIAQHACWPSIVKPLLGLRNDFLNMSASVKKFDILRDYASTLKTSASRLVITELEYLFGLCRSVYDLLQEVISGLWDNVHLIDATAKKKQLPKTFSRLALSADQPRSASELQDKFFLPEQLSEFYVRSSPFFVTLRQFRDRFYHGGETFDLVFVSDKGFAVNENLQPFASFGVWNMEHRLPNGLCSLRPAIAYIVNETLRVCEDFAVTIQRIIQFLPPVVPGFHFYMRGYFTDVLQSNRRVLEKCLWWEDDVT